MVYPRRYPLEFQESHTYPLHLPNRLDIEIESSEIGLTSVMLGIPDGVMYKTTF